MLLDSFSRFGFTVSYKILKSVVVFERLEETSIEFALQEMANIYIKCYITFTYWSHI